MLARAQTWVSQVGLGACCLFILSGPQQLGFFSVKHEYLKDMIHCQLALTGCSRGSLLCVVCSQEMPSAAGGGAGMAFMDL